MNEGADDGRTPPAPDEPDAPAAGPESAPAPAPGRARRLLPAGLLLGGVVAAGVAWAVVEFVVSGPAPDAPIRLVEAPEAPYKVRPDDPGGREFPNRDKLIYETLVTDEPEEEPELILSPPEEPVSPPAAAGATDEAGEPDAAPAAPSPEEAPPPAAAEGPPPDAAEETSPDAVEEPTPAEEPPPPAEADAAPVERPLPPPPPPRAAAQADASDAPARADGVPVPARRPARLARATAQDREAASWAAPGSVLIELGASTERADMERLWERLRRRHETALAGRDPLILRTDRGERGSLHRLRAGPFADRAAAERTCARLAARGLECTVVVN